jgi:SPP1 gp7 family putative phage head morphogenesis protein
MPPRPELTEFGFAEALEWFLRRVAMTDAEAEGLRAAVRDKAFWMANETQLRRVQDVFDSIADAIARGDSLQNWKKATVPKMRKAWGPGAVDKAGRRINVGHRMETVYRNATQSAYSRGRHDQMSTTAVKQLRPFWMYDAILDSRTSAICRPLDETILPADDEFWSTHWPPLHHRCRSSVRSLRKRDAKRRREKQKTQDKREGRARRPKDVDAQEGFGAAPSSGDPGIPKVDHSAFDDELVSSFNRKQERTL